MSVILEARFIIFAVISFASLALGGMALMALKDKDMAGGMFFNRVKEIVALYPLLLWGMVVPWILALALIIIGVFVDFWAIPAVMGVLFLVAFVSLNYFFMSVSIKLLGWR